MTRPPLSQQRPTRTLRERPALAVALALVAVHAGLWASAPGRAGGDMPVSADLQLRLDPNRACAAELMLLPRIGPKIAERIIEYRMTCPRQPVFGRADDLDAVRYIGPATVERLRPHLRFPTPPPPPANAEN